MTTTYHSEPYASPSFLLGYTPNSKIDLNSSKALTFSFRTITSLYWIPQTISQPKNILRQINALTIDIGTSHNPTAPIEPLIGPTVPLYPSLYPSILLVPSNDPNAYLNSSGNPIAFIRKPIKYNVILRLMDRSAEPSTTSNSS